MSNETIFRLCFTVVFIGNTVISMYHHNRAVKLTGEIVTRPDEGKAIFLFRSLFSFPLIIAALLYMIYPRAMAWAAMPLPNAVRWLSVGLGFVSMWLVYWTFAALGESTTPTVMTKASHQLVTNGPYRWIRHPIYTSVSIYFISLSLIAASWFLLLDSLLGIAIMITVLTKREEEMLIRKFGNTYIEYMSHTGRYLPRPGSLL